MFEGHGEGSTPLRKCKSVKVHRYGVYLVWSWLAEMLHGFLCTACAMVFFFPQITLASQQEGCSLIHGRCMEKVEKG